MASYSNEASALESPGPGGSLHWVEHMSGHWSAKGLGGRYDIYPRGAGGYTAYWSQAGTGSTHELGSYDTIGAAFGACRRHADGERRQTAAEEEDHDAVAKDVARKAVESAYGSGQVDHLSKSKPTTPGEPSFWNAWLKNGKRLTVHVNGSTGTVRDPDDGHVVTTHTVSEGAEDHSDYARAVRAGRQFALHQMKSESGYQMDHAEAVRHFERQGYSHAHAEAAAGSYGETWHRVMSAAEAEECGCPHSHPKSVPTTPCVGEAKPLSWTREGAHYVAKGRRGTYRVAQPFGRGSAWVVLLKRHMLNADGKSGHIDNAKVFSKSEQAKAFAARVDSEGDVGAKETVPVIHEVGPGLVRPGFVKVIVSVYNVEGVPRVFGVVPEERRYDVTPDGRPLPQVYSEHYELTFYDATAPKELVDSIVHGQMSGQAAYVAIAPYFTEESGGSFFRKGIRKGSGGGGKRKGRVLNEANDAGPFATIDRDTKELAKGKALGKACTPEEIYKLVRDPLEKESQEVFLVVPLDLHGELISRPVEVARGQRDRVSVGISDVMRPVAQTNAKGFVVVHNHPSGHARPSPKDKELTDTIRKHTFPDVVFLDHVVVGTDQFFSFTENKLYKVK